MQTEYLSRLSEPVRAFIQEVEKSAGIFIEVVPSPDLNDGGPAGQGTLEVIIQAHRVRIFAPTTATSMMER